jgi:RimJ/RimL family protein N-acetyltransferase
VNESVENGDAWSFRPAVAADEAFLYQLFHSARAHELWMFPEEQRETLIRMQFAGQQYTYTTNYGDGGHRIILIDGRPAGRLWLFEDDASLLVVDITLLPEYRNRGIGGRIYADLMAKAKQASKKVRCTVSSANPGSRRFHDRLGFRETSSDGFYTEMDWTAPESTNP